MKLPQYRLLKISASRKGTSIEAEWTDIVTCGECKWYNCGACFRDDGVNNSRNADDFCSYGSSSEKPNNSKERSSE